MNAAAIVVAEVVQVEDNRDASGPSPAHELEADRMPAVGQQNLGPEPVQHLVGQVEKQCAFSRTGARSARL